MDNSRYGDEWMDGWTFNLMAEVLSSVQLQTSLHSRSCELVTDRETVICCPSHCVVCALSGQMNETATTDQIYRSDL